MFRNIQAKRKLYEAQCSNAEKFTALRKQYGALGYEVYQVPHKTNPSSLPTYYAVNKTQELGRGAFGIVRPGFVINAVSGEIDLNTILAVKVIEENNFYGIADADRMELVRNEIKYFNYYYPIIDEVRHGSNDLIFMKYIEGNELYTDNESMLVKPSQELKVLSFIERTYVLMQLAVQINLFHHYTISTGPAIIHRDLKGENIKIHVDALNKKIDVNILDFGLSKRQDQTNDREAVAGTLAYLPIEAVKQKCIGPWTDIYALVPIFIVVLGGKTPFAIKNRTITSAAIPDEFFSAKYDYTGILERYDVPKKDIILKLTTQFLDRMQDDHHKRPTSEEVLRFTKNLCALSYALGLGHVQLPKDSSETDASEININENDVNEFIHELELLIEPTLLSETHRLQPVTVDADNSASKYLQDHLGNMSFFTRCDDEKGVHPEIPLSVLSSNKNRNLLASQHSEAVTSTVSSRNERSTTNSENVIIQGRVAYLSQLFEARQFQSASLPQQKTNIGKSINTSGNR